MSRLGLQSCDGSTYTIHDVMSDDVLSHQPKTIPLRSLRNYGTIFDKVMRPSTNGTARITVHPLPLLCATWSIGWTFRRWWRLFWPTSGGDAGRWHVTIRHLFCMGNLGVPGYFGIRRQVRWGRLLSVGLDTLRRT